MSLRDIPIDCGAFAQARLGITAAGGLISCTQPGAPATFRRAVDTGRSASATGTGSLSFGAARVGLPSRRPRHTSGEVANKSELKSGVAVAAAAATKKPDGTFTAARIDFGRGDVLP
jgi:hypothetical protein